MSNDGNLGLQSNAVASVSIPEIYVKSTFRKRNYRQVKAKRIYALFIFMLTALHVQYTVKWSGFQKLTSLVIVIATDEHDFDEDEHDVEADEDDSDDEENEVESASTTTINRVDKLRQTLEVNFSGNKIENDLGLLTAESATDIVVDAITRSLKTRLEILFTKAITSECRTKIGQHMSYFINAFGKEESLPFADVMFPNECGEPVYDFRNMPDGIHIGDIQNRTYQPPRNESSEYIDDPDNLILLYGILTHNDPMATIRLIDSLDEDGLQHKHQFVVHVDGKEIYDNTQLALLEYSATKSNVHIVPNDKRVRVNWGGFSMVNATLQILKYAFDIDNESKYENAIGFHKFIHLSSSTYPIASNPEIRHRLASYPLDANFLYIIMQPTRASPYVWHYFVECDDALHRIYQLPVLRDPVHGANTFTSSQWFIASYEFAQYLAEAPSGSFVDHFIRYAEHVVVADETFFGTVLRHTKFCHKHHNNNFLHLQFDRWESDLPASKRDERKCPMPNPDHCGRSPTLMTVDYADIMELSDNLFARKVIIRPDAFCSKLTNLTQDIFSSGLYSLIQRLIHK
jgi:Core-2/I-Branching enzyme